MSSGVVGSLDHTCRRMPYEGERGEDSWMHIRNRSQREVEYGIVYYWSRRCLIFFWSKKGERALESNVFPDPSSVIKAIDA